MARSKNNETPSVDPTHYTEVSRIHRAALSTLKGTLVITSTQKGEGSTLVSQLLAQRSAENGTKTLIIDLNMRNTSISQTMGLPRKPWRLNERAINEPVDDLISASKDVKGLSILTSPTDEESIRYLKDVNNAAAFFATLERTYDHIIVDTTPVENVNRYNADPIILASAAKRTIVVLMAGKTPQEKVKNTVKQLREAGANIKGVVVNDRKNPTLKDEMLALAESFKRVSPGFYAWMRHKITNSAAFNE